MKYFVILVSFLSFQIHAQELFVMTEPASNMPTASIGVRDMSLFAFKKTGGYNYHNMPELMWGVNKDWMVHASAFLSDKQGDLMLEGGSLYAKYRFFSVDDLHSHFRLAAYGRISTSNAEIHQEDIETMGMNSGYEIGTVATQLINKTALSASISYERAFNNQGNIFPDEWSNSAMNYTFSVGQLMYPKKYTNFKQTNINAMLELLGQRLNQNGKSYLDVVPSIQFIVNSQARIDLAYRRQIYSDMERISANSILLKLEYTFFNVTN
ncbi:hypothetical protein SAMN05443543_101488 [Flavobacterium flevense]|uniref:DUF481 domain-containing protein n=1 Tax=Flavobacterium flevense TaxID=983 RepID=A0A4Y4B137_9FLAO|nr:hypothetical protein [Flavobacterium flevense]GEC72970.1 hypothetical protein FFL01_25090 [Flavobacterium flevense]SHL35834.1 hypothetical protein SAMN05443543_101488 [Flavobacterium flevense]